MSKIISTHVEATVKQQEINDQVTVLVKGTEAGWVQNFFWWNS